MPNPWHLALALMFLNGCKCADLPPVSDCAPLAYRCDGAVPQVCSSTRRWHPIGDVPCLNGCVIEDNVASCAGRTP